MYPPKKFTHKHINKIIVKKKKENFQHHHTQNVKAI